MRIAVAGATGTVGRHVVSLAQEAGHESMPLSRSHGVDLRSHESVAAALAGVDAVIDVTNAGTVEQGPATEFFTSVASNLQRAGADHGIGHIVTLSIVGIDKTSFGYYQAKREHERAAHGPVPSTIMRATQFHEFPAQVIAMTREDGHASVFDVDVQTVAARTVAATLLRHALAGPAGRAPDLAGPARANLVDLARALVEHKGAEVEIRAHDGMDGVPDGALLPEPGAELAGPTFEEWLAGPDAAELQV